MMDFYEELKELALVPSEFQREGQMTRLLKKKLGGLVDSMTVDKIGNLYAVRQGSKPGKLMLSAHQDKVMQSTIAGHVTSKKIEVLESNIILTSKKMFKYAQKSSLFMLTDQGYVPVELVSDKKNTKKSTKLVTIPTPFAGYDRKRLKLYVPRGLSINIDGLTLHDMAEIYGLVELQKDKKHVYGKLDDTVGLSILLDILRSTDPEDTPTLMVLLTVGEEKGCCGSSYIVNDTGFKQGYTPDKIMVIDTTSLQEPGTGIVLYDEYGKTADIECGFAPVEDGVVFDTLNIDDIYEEFDDQHQLCLDFLYDLQNFAAENNYQLTTHPAFPNDAMVFANATKIPTVALEVPILDMHNAVETCAIKDIELMRKFLREYITK